MKSMPSKQNQKKADQLDMPYGTAYARLRKQVMFNLIQLCNLDICFQCGTSIDSLDDMSIEHKVPWLDSKSPRDLFFDLNNIAFSHLKCNVGAARKTILRHPCPSHAAYKKGCRCENCIEAFRTYERNQKRRIRKTPKESWREVR